MEVDSYSFKEGHVYDIHFRHGSIYEIICIKHRFVCLYCYDDLTGWTMAIKGSSFKKFTSVEEVVDHGESSGDIS